MILYFPSQRRRSATFRDAPFFVEPLKTPASFAQLPSIAAQLDLM
jgi:hypothetical protein